MQKPVNNLTDAPIILGGVKIGKKSQRAVRESLISDKEKKAITGAGKVIDFKPGVITVRKANGDQKIGAGNNQNQAQNNANKGGAEFAHVAYPSKYIKNDGELSGTVAFKNAIKKLQEEYGEKIVTDNEFIDLYPEADIEAYRVKVENEQIDE